MTQSSESALRSALSAGQTWNEAMDAIAAFTADKSKVTITEIEEGVWPRRLNQARPARPSAKVISRLLLELGWTQSRRRDGSATIVIYHRPEAENATEPVDDTRQWSWWAGEGLDPETYQVNEPTREAAIKAARREYGDTATITIVEATQDGPFSADIFDDRLMLNISDRFADVNDGRWGENGFDGYCCSESEEDELRDALRNAFAGWLAKYGRFIPTFTFTAQRNKETYPYPGEIIPHDRGVEGDDRATDPPRPQYPGHSQSGEGRGISRLSDDLLPGANAAAKFLGISPRKIYHMVDAGHLPVNRKGKRLYFRKSELERAFSSSTGEPAR